jgi:hypothetical protein
MFRFTIRDVLWLTVVVALAVGWAIASQRSVSRENLYKLWAFDIAASIVKDKTGDTMTVDHMGVCIARRDGTTLRYSFGE